MKFLVIGCGYLGAQTARLWRSLEHDVYVTTRSQQRADQFSKAGFKPVIADVTLPDTLSTLPEADVVLFSVGFDRSGDDDIHEVYVDGLENVLQRLPKSVKHLVYISSTGVLANSDGQWVDEAAPTAPSRIGGKAHLQAEQILLESDYKDRCTILRLAGIYGANRVPRLAAVIKRQWDRLPKTGHVNLIHVEDAAGIINCVVERELVDQLYHVSDGEPPLRRELYEFVAAEIDAGTIDWSQTTDAMVAIRSSIDKKICNKKVQVDTQYQYRYPEFRTGVRAALAATDLDRPV